jgi:hypothetical protein
MSKLQDTLNSLKPYIIGIRYVEGTLVLDTLFKDGWSIPEDKLIKTLKGEEDANYYMIYSEDKRIELDNLIQYVEKVISLNKEREKKLELYSLKLNELKSLFAKTPLSKLINLKFTFEDTLPSIDDFSLNEEMDETITPNNIQTTPNIVPQELEVNESNIGKVNIIAYDVKLDDIEEPYQEPLISKQTPITYVDDNGNPIPMSEEELEILEEEARGEKNRRAIEQIKKSKNIDLPPKKKMMTIR